MKDIPDRRYVYKLESIFIESTQQKEPLWNNKRQLVMQQQNNNGCTIAKSNLKLLPANYNSLRNTTMNHKHLDGDLTPKT